MTSCVEPTESLGTFLEELLPDQEAELLHLLDCPACQGRARERLERRSLTAEAVEVEYDGMLRDLEERMPALLARRDEQTAVARRLRDRLLAAPVEERHFLAGTMALRDLGLVDLLLVDSWQLQPAEPALSEERALLALLVAAQFPEPRLAGRVNDLKARAFVLIASARRLMGDRREAEEGFGRAVACLTCPPDALERGFYCQQLAALRREQGREDEATGLLWRAALVYNENADLVEEGACLAELGFLFLAEDQPHRAVLPLSRACEVLGLHRDASLAVRAQLSLALCEAILGHEAKALRLLKAARPMYGRVADSPLQMAHVSWLEGKVARLTGRQEQAMDLLERARQGFLAQLRLYEVALTSLDLITVRAKAGRLESVLPLIQDVVEAFPADLGQAGVLLALGSVETALLAGKGGALDDVLAATAGMIRRFRREPLLAFEGFPRARAYGIDPNG
jgi:tetratricopeptide (TPR) repeat protein